MPKHVEALKMTACSQTVLAIWGSYVEGRDQDRRAPKWDLELDDPLVGPDARDALARRLAHSRTRKRQEASQTS